MRKFTEQESDIARKVLEIGLGLVVALVVAVLSKPKTFVEGLDSVTSGLLATLTTTFILELGEIRRSLRDLRDRLELDFNSFSEQASRHLLILKFGNKKLLRTEMPSAWESLLWQMRGNFDATSHVKPSDFKDAYPELGLAIQKAKITVNQMRIRRIFIVEDESELTFLRPQVAQQEEAGIQVSYITLEEVRKFQDLDHFDTLDFGLLEHDSSRFVFLWLLQDRHVVGGKVELQPERHARYRLLFDDLCPRSRPFPRTVAGAEPVHPG